MRIQLQNPESARNSSGQFGAMVCAATLAVALFITPAVYSANDLPENVTSPSWAPEFLLNPNLYLSQPGGYESNLEKTIQATWKLSEDKLGLTPLVTYYGVFLANPSGGQTRNAAWFQLLQFGGQISFDRYGWKGGSVTISVADGVGQNLSNSIGNVFTVAQNVDMNSIGLNDLYLSQKFGDSDFLELRAGRMAPASSFATLPIEGLAVSGAANANPSSLSTNTTFKTANATSWGAYASLTPSTTFSAQTGIYQADPRAGLAAYHGLDFSIRPGDGILMFGETDWTPTFGQTSATTGKDGKTVTPANPGLPGVYQFGSYYSNYTFTNFLGGGNQHNAYGFYLQGQQMVWRQPGNPNFNLTLWGGVTYSPQYQFSLLPVMGFGGVVLQGLIPGRTKDSLFMNAYIGGFSSDYSASSISAGTGKSTAETDLEWGYVVQLTNNLQFQPDLQYIIKPNGGGIPNALVIGFQIAAVF